MTRTVVLVDLVDAHLIGFNARIWGTLINIYKEFRERVLHQRWQESIISVKSVKSPVNESLKSHLNTHTLARTSSACTNLCIFSSVVTILTILRVGLHLRPCPVQDDECWPFFVSVACPLHRTLVCHRLQVGTLPHCRSHGSFFLYSTTMYTQCQVYINT